MTHFYNLQKQSNGEKYKSYNERKKMVVIKRQFLLFYFCSVRTNKERESFACRKTSLSTERRNCLDFIQPFIDFQCEQTLYSQRHNTVQKYCTIECTFHARLFSKLNDQKVLGKIPLTYQPWLCQLHTRSSQTDKNGRDEDIPLKFKEVRNCK